MNDQLYQNSQENILKIFWIYSLNKNMVAKLELLVFQSGCIFTIQKKTLSLFLYGFNTFA